MKALKSSNNVYNINIFNLKFYSYYKLYKIYLSFSQQIYNISTFRIYIVHKEKLMIN